MANIHVEVRSNAVRLVVAPRVLSLLTSCRREVPLFYSRQSALLPLAVRNGIVPGQIHYRSILVRQLIPPAVRSVPYSVDEKFVLPHSNGELADLEGANRDPVIRIGGPPPARAVIELLPGQRGIATRPAVYVVGFGAGVEQVDHVAGKVEVALVIDFKAFFVLEHGDDQGEGFGTVEQCPSAVFQKQGEETLGAGLAEGRTEEAEELAPLRCVAMSCLQDGCRLILLPQTFQVRGREIFLKRQVQEFDLRTAADEDARVEFFLLQKLAGFVAVGDLRLQQIGGEGPLGLGNAPSRMRLHAKGEEGQELDALLIAAAAGLAFTGAGKPVEDGLVKIGAVIGEAAFVVVNGRKRGEHDGRGGHAVADFGTGVDLGEQFLGVAFGLGRVFRIEARGPGVEERFDCLGFERGDAFHGEFGR